MKRIKKHLSVFIAVAFIAGIWGCVEPTNSSLVTSVAQAKSSDKEEKSPYAQDVKPLSTLDCARCHYSVFEIIRDKGGKHQLDCQFCHETFHTYRPDKNWADVVPQCTTCHGEIHGAAFLDCLSCHGNAHMPIAGLSNMATLEKDCANCHTAQAAEVTQYPSAHSKVACSDCHHTQHGYKPACVECHEQPHADYADNNSCMGCHPVHKPLEIHYSEETPNTACATCHEDINSRLISTHKKHASLQCAYCHKETHGNIPQCQDCHGLPHSKGMLDKFNGCTDCHFDPHALVLPGH
jgi:hypothetical protein